MSEMVDRATKAVMSVWAAYPDHALCGRGPINPSSGAHRWAPALGGPSPHEFASAALLAALDPEDEALVEIGARALWKAHAFPMPGIAPRTWDRFKEESPFDYEMFRGYAIATLVAFKAAAQGGSDA